MMYKESNSKPKEWLNKMTYILNTYLFIFLLSVVYNLIVALKLHEDNTNIFFIITIPFYFAFYLNKKNMTKFILKFDPPRYYVKTKPIKDLINIFLVFLSILLSIFLFIFSFKMQNYI
ncbi:MAG: hypothetical protein BM557_08575 [Flavobacterium sp. MedPE-SWcel]|nr:MAG: hypothetical protein BM557_08575 [Flavobacterium sp. MedPE-SWcel]